MDYTKKNIMLRHSIGNYMSYYSISYEAVFYNYALSKAESKDLSTDASFINYFASAKELSENIEFIDSNGNPTDALKIASVTLGVSEKALLENDEKDILKWDKKYEFFSLNRSFYRNLIEAEYGCSPEEARLRSILGDTKRGFDNTDIHNRVLKQLKELSTYIPDIDIDSEIKITYVESEILTHFEEMPRLLACYLEIHSRFKELFFAAWDRTLSDEEIREYNFLVNVLDAKEKITRKDLYYDLLQKNIPYYKIESFHDLQSFVRIDLTPYWHCAEFTINRKLAEEYLNINYKSKTELRDFAMKANKIQCEYKYKNDDPDQFDDARTIYIDKTEKELNGCGDLAKQLLRLSGCEKEGGVKITYPDDYRYSDRKNWFKRLLLRFGDVDNFKLEVV